MGIDWNTTLAAIWRHQSGRLRPVRMLDTIDLVDLIGIDAQKQHLVQNTLAFLQRRPAHNALLWGARGTGKSSLVKALLNAYHAQGLRVVQVDREDLLVLPEIVDELRELPQRFIIFCDDFSFETEERTYKALKTVLDGSIEVPPENILLYATSNRRHLLPEFMSENQASRMVGEELHLADSLEEKIALSDRFGLWLSFHPVDQNTYLRMVESHLPEFQGDREQLQRAALQFAQVRGVRSGRTAHHFARHYRQQQE
ncbi:MAG: ATP-binding protein [Gammaproteobacteria bacterium]